MKKLEKIHSLSILLIVLIVGCGSTKEAIAQQPTDEEQIVGTWIAEDNPNVKLVFTENGLQKDYINGELVATYYWTLEERHSPSGLTGNVLILTNVQDSDDVTEYMIDTLTDDRLVLVYNTGIGMSRIPYNRQ